MVEAERYAKGVTATSAVVPPEKGGGIMGPASRGRGVHVDLLDVGTREYGDAVLCRLGGTSILVDGAHTGDQDANGRYPGLAAQISELLDQSDAPYTVDLLVITHAHEDHIGCLPAMVQDGTLAARWALVADPEFGWGRDGSDLADAGDPRVVQVTAALREEVRSLNTTDRELSQLLTDAVTLEQRYRSMLATLERGGTRIVRHGRDDPTALLHEFVAIGLEILGPSTEQLQACADALGGRKTDAVDLVVAALDDAPNPVDAYRSLVASDAIDERRTGNLVNLQSIVLAFEYSKRKLLLAGDMQFAAPGTRDRTIVAGVGALRAAIAERAPFQFAKLSHHGSDNAFSAEILDDLGATPSLGICAGSTSAKHPNRVVLDLLEQHADELEWVRTDRNGLSTVDLTGEQPAITVTRGRLNDQRPNNVDELTPPAGPPIVRAMASAGAPGMVEVITRIPSSGGRVTVSIDVAGSGETNHGPTAVDTTPISLAAGRALPRLLFVTDATALGDNVGQAEAARVLDALRASNLPLIETLGGTRDANHAVARVRHELSRDLSGVVIVGGYDVVPSVRTDCLPPRVRARVDAAADPDEFIVWSDDSYGDLDGDSLAELPVSRIPDAKTAALILAALQADAPPRPTARSGIRNVERPFAEPIFSALPGDRPISISEPDTYTTLPSDALTGDALYFMLHGDWIDSTRFWGENTPDGAEAVNVSVVPSAYRGVAFAGCCWGALTVDTIASRAIPSRPIGPKSPGSSIALSILAAGANAFVGCTGVHYSPTETPYGYYGGPLHEAFWNSYVGGASAAAALLAAKQAYAAGMPHKSGDQNLAIDYKIFREFTCLGLGW